LHPELVYQLLDELPFSSKIVEYIIATEKHEDGTPHIHAYLKYDNKVQFGKTRWDLVVDGVRYHGNYQACDKWQNVAKYCIKDGDYKTNFDIHAALNKKSCMRERNMMFLTRPLPELVQEGHLDILKYIQAKANIAAYRQDSDPVLPRAVGFIPNTWNLELPIKDDKCRHYWFWSERPNRGKTTFLKNLDSLYPCYWMNFGEKYQHLHPQTQFVFLDEYSTARMLCTEINSMCDGKYPYSQKNLPSITLADPIIIICSNRAPEEVYPNKIELIRARFTFFNLD